MKLCLTPAVLALASILTGAGGAAEPVTETTEAQDAELGAEEQSFSDYDATDDALAAVGTNTPSDHELTLFAIPAPRLVGLSGKKPGGLARRTLVSNGLGLHRSLGHAA